MQRKRVRLHDLAQGIFEGYAHDGMSKRFVPGIGNSSVHIVDGSANKILRSAGFEIRDFYVGNIGWRGGCNFRFLPEKKDGEPNYDYNHTQTRQHGDEFGFLFFRLQRRWIDQPAHAEIVLSPARSKVKQRDEVKAGAHVQDVA